jgi:hypothetical protein
MPDGYCPCCGQPYQQPTLLDADLPARPRSRSGDPWTSAAAADLAPTRIQPDNDLGAVLLAFWSEHPRQLTADDVADGDRSRHRRVSELVRAGYLYWTGDTAMSRWHRQMRTFALTIRGEALAETLASKIKTSSST